MAVGESKRLDWSGRTALVVASGPSLKTFIDAPEDTRGVKTIVTNSSAFGVPFADVVFGVDFMWWKMHHASVARGNPSRCWTTERNAAERFGVNFVRGGAPAGIDTARVAVNGNSGAAAINLAVLFGARRILLLGFDMQESASGAKHWHPDHPKPCVQAQCFSDWLYRFDAIARDCGKLGIEVVNCTPGGALNVFPRAPLKEMLTCRKQ